MKRRHFLGLTALLLPLAACGDESPEGQSSGELTSGPPGESVSAPPGDSLRPLTLEEAERFAVARFRLFEAGSLSITGTLTDGTSQVYLSGFLNTATGTGFARALPTEISTGNTDVPALLWWDRTTLGTRPAEEAVALLPPPTDGWQYDALDPSASYLFTGLLVLANLASDRPDNPQLLAQSAARWVRTDVVAGEEVDVFTGPDSESGASGAQLRYSIGSTGTLRRLEVQLGTDQWSLVDFGTTDQEVPALDPGR